MIAIAKSKIIGHSRESGNLDSRLKHSGMTLQGCFVAILLAMMTQSASVYACPACKEAVAKLGEAWTWIGFNWSILFMITIPLLLVISFGTAIFFLVRKNQSHP